MIDTSFFQELDRFSFMVRKRVSTAYSGSRRSLLRGRGMEPVSYREYTKGDDFKIIDWKVYGHNEKFGVSTFGEEINITKPKRGRRYLSQTIDLLNNTALVGKTRFDYCMEK